MSFKLLSMHSTAITTKTFDLWKQEGIEVPQLIYEWIAGFERPEEEGEQSHFWRWGKPRWGGVISGRSMRRRSARFFFPNRRS
jgi:hypothetical protein